MRTKIEVSFPNTSEPSPFDGSITLTGKAVCQKRNRMLKGFDNLRMSVSNFYNLPPLSILDRSHDYVIAEEIKKGEWD